jgi:hypothetical protein
MFAISTKRGDTSSLALYDALWSILESMGNTTRIYLVVSYSYGLNLVIDKQQAIVVYIPYDLPTVPRRMQETRKKPQRTPAFSLPSMP